MEGASRGLNFAEQQLQRHGWTPGKGLGRREDGIAKAIKVKMKQDNAGVGHDPAEQFTNHWWSHLFNRTAAKIVVETGQNGVQMKTKEDTSASRSRKAPSLLYGHFVKSATLTASGEQPAEKPRDGHGGENTDKSGPAAGLTDEELVRACRGRTAHKGARHGLTMSAKLARLEEQERAFLARHGPTAAPSPSALPPGERTAVGALGSEDDDTHKRKKRKKKREEKEPEAQESGDGETQERGDSRGVKKKKKKKKKERMEEDLEEEVRENLDVARRKKRKKTKS
ncbi:G patch domain-containing protein 4 isoform X2 [Ornithorhynchus anatinus]|nr:G patch domain-containing protein 4 isoform X2 [Ornithorhynchus anatinus]